jgi:hypothetical protein
MTIPIPAKSDSHVPCAQPPKWQTEPTSLCRTPPSGIADAGCAFFAHRHGSNQATRQARRGFGTLHSPETTDPMHSETDATARLGTASLDG